MHRGPLRPTLLLLSLILSSHLVYAQSAPSQKSPADAIKAADAAFRAGSAAYQRNDLRTAHTEFARVVHLAPKIAAGHTAFGTVLLAENNPKAAATELELAHKLDPSDTNATLNLALAYTQLRDYAKAIPLFQTADEAHVQLTPDQTISYATALEATSQLAVAQTQIEQALAISPNSAALHDALGTLLAQQERYNEATLHFQQAIALDPSLAA